MSLVEILRLNPPLFRSVSPPPHQSPHFSSGPAELTPELHFKVVRNDQFIILENSNKKILTSLFKVQ